MTRRILAITLGLALVFLGDLAGPGPAAQEDRPQDRAALRTLRDAGVKALNTRDFTAIAALVHPDFSIVAVDQQRFKSLAEFQAHWQGLFEGPKATLRSIALTPETEAVRFVAEDLALSDGTSTDTYVFADGDTRVMKVRWSAVIRRVEGQWRFLSIHIGTDLFDNPVLHAATATGRKTATGAGAGGLVIGALLGLWLGRRRAGAGSK